MPSESFNSARRYTKKPGRYSTRGALLFVLPLPLLIAVVVSLARGAPGGVLANTAAAALYLLGAGAARRGFKNELVYLSKRVAVPPKVPYKFFAALLVALATLLAAKWGAGHTMLTSLCFGAGAFAGFYFAYGFDPRAEKGAVSGYGYSAAEIAAALDEAEGRLARIDASATRIDNQELRERLRRIVQKSRKILKVIEEDPKDLRRARKFLNTYLEGAERVTEGYAKNHERSGAGELETNFRNVLVTIEKVFEQQYHKLLEDDALDLDVQIEVLTTQLKKEGVI